VHSGRGNEERAEAGRKTKTPDALISTRAKVALHRRRPLTDWEREWLSTWFCTHDYFRSHRRLFGGTARKLCDEMDAERGLVTDAEGSILNLVTDENEASIQSEDSSNKPHPVGVQPSAV
jgi:hypothetical protein